MWLNTNTISAPKAICPEQALLQRLSKGHPWSSLHGLWGHKHMKTGKNLRFSTQIGIYPPSTIASNCYLEYQREQVSDMLHKKKFGTVGTPGPKGYNLHTMSSSTPRQKKIESTEKLNLRWRLKVINISSGNKILKKLCFILCASYTTDRYYFKENAHTSNQSKKKKTETKQKLICQVFP